MDASLLFTLSFLLVILCQGPQAQSFYAYEDEEVAVNCSQIISHHVCTECHAGSHAVAGVEECFCCNNVTKSASCIQPYCDGCLPGFYQPKPGQWECLGCDPGSYCKVANCTACDPCESGHAVGVANATGCSPCKPGSFVEGKGGTTCTNCTKGYYQPDKGETACLKCDVGHFQNRTGQPSCRPCPAGTYQTEAGQSVCLVCPRGHYQDKPGQTECLPCAGGTYANSTGTSQCLGCPPGYSRNSTGAYDCEVCPSGTSQEGPGGTQCNICAANKWCNVTGCARCSNCEDGSDTKSHTGSTSCSACLAGQYQRGGGPCRECPSGYYGLQTHMASCVRCEIGHYCPCPKCHYACPSDTVCPAGSAEPHTCNYLLYRIKADKCTLSTVFVLIMVVGAIGVVVITSLIAVAVKRYRRRQIQYDPDDETAQLTSNRERSNEPVYSGW